MVRNSIEKVLINNPHGGVGSIEIEKVLTMDDKFGDLSLFAKVIIKPQTSIGFHQHVGEAEAYYVLKGEGYFINNQKERVRINPGTICVIEVGQSHGLENPNDNEMEIIAIVRQG
ncbi:cupin domain-containing protein [Halalkalibacter okhensis]|uniref:Cupin type-2 domain-containing protein n=1 Tax=Halalkalibacter okhensis TaxID=333138 RepID=A0A0B0IDY1_9BACI|nr:cupin domain-containing protein [Halalkalibacter okhensis]KHF39510.1 hypothetical protein LQ50_14715 [Halalkalibacter okhensis]